MRGMYQTPPERKSIRRQIEKVGRAGISALWQDVFLRMKMKTPEWIDAEPLDDVWKARKEWFRRHLILQGVGNEDAGKFSEIEARYRQYLSNLYGVERVADSRLDILADSRGNMCWSIGAIKFVVTQLY